MSGRLERSGKRRCPLSTLGARVRRGAYTERGSASVVRVARWQREARCEGGRTSWTSEGFCGLGFCGANPFPGPGPFPFPDRCCLLDHGNGASGPTPRGTREVTRECAPAPLPTGTPASTAASPRVVATLLSLSLRRSRCRPCLKPPMRWTLSPTPLAEEVGPAP